jgi:radical SAM superfamily enzyme YgiQ (UPF0313 family)
MAKHLPDYELLELDLNLSKLSTIDKIVKDNDIKYVGVSLRNIDDNNIYEKGSFIDWYKEITDKIRSVSKAKIILGGAGFSIFPGYLLEFLDADFGIKGEGERSLVDLINLLESGGNFDSIQGLIYRKNSGKLVQNSRTDYLQNLDLDFNLENIDFYWNKSGMLNIQTKRGCPKQCIYCSYPIIEGEEVRTLNIDTIISTLSKLKNEQKINYVFFTDSIFNINKKYNRELCEAMIDSGVKVDWGAYFAPDTSLKFEDLELYKKAGLTHIEFGTDSFCDITLKSYKKSFGFKDVLKKSEICNELCIFFSHFLILGGYGETNETLTETFENSKLIDNSVFFPYTGMRIYPNTELYDIAIAEGKISKNDKLLKPAYYVSDNLDLSNLKEKAKATGKKWIFPDEEKSDFYDVLRARKRRGPLWEYLRY